jgi:hypothetical protein
MGIEPPLSVPHPGVTERAIDAATDVSRTIQEVTERLRLAVNSLHAAVDRVQRPGEPLDRLRALTREAPLTSLSIAFLIGVAFARRR